MSERNDLTAIVPFRDDRGTVRRRNLDVILRWLAAAGIGTLLCEYADAPSRDLSHAPHAKHVFIASGVQPFSKARACNAGFRLVATPLIALVDADTFMPSAGFLECAEAVREGLDVVRPFGHLIDLDEQTSAAIARGELDAGAKFLPAEGVRQDGSRSGEHIPLCGGLVILRSMAYEAVGGMDETFEGWGGEDDALSAALLRSGLQCGIHDSHPAYHLAHPRTPESRYGHEYYARNRDRARWWHEADEGELAGAIAVGRQRLASG